MDEHGYGTVVMAAIVPAHSDGFVPESHRVPYYPLHPIRNAGTERFDSQFHS